MIQDLGFGVWGVGFGFGVCGLGFGVWLRGLGFGVWGSGFWCWGSEVKLQNLGFEGLWCRGSWFQGLGYRG